MVTEEQIDQFFQAAAPVLGCDPPQSAPQSAPSTTSSETGTNRDALTIEDTRDALAQIEGGNDYDRWLTVMAALHHASDGSAEGLLAFHEWSRRWSNYKPGACDRKWRENLPAITTGTLIHLAGQANPEWISPSVRRKLAETQSRMRPANDPRRFQMLSRAAVAALAEPEWLVPGIIAENSLCVLYGPPGSLKSFLALDLSFRLAFAESLDGSAQTPRRVLYVSGEGEGGLRCRMEAWDHEHGTADRLGDIHFLLTAVNLLDPADVACLIDSLREQGAPAFDLIVLDTLARCMPGAPENAPEAMSAAIASADRIRREFDTALLLVHHSGKDAARGPRGHSVLLAAIDTAIEVARSGAGLVAKLTKQKDAGDSVALRFVAETIELSPHPRTGRPRSSLVLTRQDEAEAEKDEVMATRLIIARHSQPGAVRTFSDLCLRAGWSKGGTAYARIRAGIPPVDWVSVRLGGSEVRRLRHTVTKVSGQDADAIECEVVQGAVC